MNICLIFSVFLLLESALGLNSFETTFVGYEAMNLFYNLHLYGMHTFTYMNETTLFFLDENDHIQKIGLKDSEAISTSCFNTFATTKRSTSNGLYININDKVLISIVTPYGQLEPDFGDRKVRNIDYRHSQHEFGLIRDCNEKNETTCSWRNGSFFFTKWENDILPKAEPTPLPEYEISNCVDDNFIDKCDSPQFMTLQQEMQSYLCKEKGQRKTTRYVFNDLVIRDVNSQ